MLSQGHKSNKKQTNLQNTLGSELEQPLCVGKILFLSIEVFKLFSIGYLHIFVYINIIKVNIPKEKYYKLHNHIYQFHGI